MDLTPSVIHKEMLIAAIKEQSKPGEMARLNEESPIDFGSIQSIRLEFLGILKINHLWPLRNLRKISLNYNKIDTIENLDILANLKELDLSFNYIERIQGLDKLLNLEVLSLFSNRIETIENLEHLKELIILNIGANKIDSLKGFERLRVSVMPKLKVFNMERNPIGERLNVRQLVSAYLPNLKYYNYIQITQEEKDAAAKEYSRELRDLNERETQEMRSLQEKKLEIEQQRHHHQCFVEELDSHQLFEELFKEEPNIIQNIPMPKTELQLKMFSLTQKIFEIGLNRFEERQQEVEAFRICLVNAKRRNQLDGQGIICDVMELWTSKKSTESELTNAIEEAWTQLMEMEIQLFENIEDITKSFEFIVADLINDFVKDVQSLFDQIQEAISAFAENLQQLLTSGEEKSEISPEFVLNWWKDQKKVINKREFILQERAREWAANLIESFKEEEVKRNRKKIIEINYFFDSLRMDPDFEYALQTRREISNKY